MHIAVTTIAAEGLAKAQAPVSQIIGFLADNLSTYHPMLRQESLVAGQIDNAVLLRVTERDITAGRMQGNVPLRAFAAGVESLRDNPLAVLFHADPSTDDKPLLTFTTSPPRPPPRISSSHTISQFALLSDLPKF